MSTKNLTHPKMIFISTDEPRPVKFCVYIQEIVSEINISPLLSSSFGTQAIPPYKFRRKRKGEQSETETKTCSHSIPRSVVRGYLFVSAYLVSCDI